MLKTGRVHLRKPKYLESGLVTVLLLQQSRVDGLGDGKDLLLLELACDDLNGYRSTVVDPWVIWTTAYRSATSGKQASLGGCTGYSQASQLSLSRAFLGRYESSTVSTLLSALVTGITAAQ